jgi:hypothetical protein
VALLRDGADISLALEVVAAHHYDTALYAATQRVRISRSYEVVVTVRDEGTYLGWLGRGFPLPDTDLASRDDLLLVYDRLSHPADRDGGA